MLAGDDSEKLWREIADVRLLPTDGRAIWRISVPPASGPATLAAIARATDATGFYDWGGGLIWVAVPDSGEAAIVRAAFAGNGQATLIRAPEVVRASVAVFQPLPAPLAALTKRVKESFDPQRRLNRGRMYVDV
jgi:glycolate oxidase FAD binding subunit